MAARADILEKVKKSRQEAERRIQESNKKDEQARQASQREYEQNTSSEIKQAASYMKKYSTPERAGNTVSDYAQKRKQLTSWYKGDKPTEIETLAKIVKETERDRAFGEKLYGYYEQAKQEGEWAETYDKATSRYAAALGLPEGTAINDEFFEQMKPHFAAGVTTDAGNLSTAKKNGADALFAANLAGLYDDYQKTKTLKNESDNMFKEIQYWVGKGLTDDEIRKKVDIEANGAYGNLRKAKAKTATGEYEPTTEAIPALTSYGVDGMIWAARNPGKSTGDYKLDAVQGAMGRGVQHTSTPEEIARRTPGSDTYNPYANGTTMDKEAIMFGAGKEFSSDWLDKNRAAVQARNDEKEIAAFNRVYDAEMFTREAESEYKGLMDQVETTLKNNPDLDADTLIGMIFGSEDAPNYKALAKLDQSFKDLDTVSMTRGIDYDRKSLEKMIRDTAASAQLRAQATTDSAAMETVVGEEKKAAAAANGGTLITPGVVEETVPDSVTRSVVYDGANDDNFIANGVAWWKGQMAKLEKNRLDRKQKKETEKQQKLEEEQKQKETEDKLKLDMSEQILSEPDASSSTPEPVAVLASAGASDVAPKMTTEEFIAAQEQVYALEAEGRYEEAAKAQFPLIVAAVTNSDDEYVKELVTSVGSQETALHLAQLVLQGDMLDNVDDLDVFSAVTDYEYYICKVLDIDTASADTIAQAMDFITGAIDYASGGAYTDTKDNEGVGVLRTVQSAATQGLAKANDVWAEIAGAAITGYGHVVKGTNWLVDNTIGKLFGFKMASNAANKTVEAGQNLSAYYDKISEKEDAFMRQNATSLEYYVAGAGSEAIKMGVMAATGSAITGAAGTAVDGVSKVMTTKDGLKILTTAMDLAKIQGFTSHLAAASPFIAESAAKEFNATYAETKNPVTALLAGTVSGFATTALMNMDAIKNIERMGKYVPDVTDALRAMPGTGLLACGKRYGKAGMMYIGNMFKTAANEMIQEPTENILTTWVTDTLKGKGFFTDRDWKEYSKELAQDTFYAAIGSFGNTIAAMPAWGRSATYANQMMGKTGLTAQEVIGQVNAFIEDMNDPQVVAQLEANMNEAAVEVRTGELVREGALPEVDTSAVTAAEKGVKVAEDALVDAEIALTQATAESDAALAAFQQDPSDKNTARLSAALKQEDKAKQDQQKASAGLQTAQTALGEAQSAVQAQSNAAMETVRTQARAEVEQTSKEAETQRQVETASEWNPEKSVFQNILDTNKDANDLYSQIRELSGQRTALVQSITAEEWADPANPKKKQEAEMEERMHALQTELDELVERLTPPEVKAAEERLNAAKQNRDETDRKSRKTPGFYTNRQYYDANSEYSYAKWAYESAVKQHNQSVAAPASSQSGTVTTAADTPVETVAPSATVPVAPAPQMESAPAATPAIAPAPSGMGVSQFAGQTGQNTQVLSDKVKAELRESPYYQKTTQQGNVDKAIAAIDREGYETRKTKLLDGTTNLFSPEGQAEAFVLARAAKEAGDVNGESAIAFKVKETGTTLGQSLAMRALYVSMTPEGKMQYVQRIVDQINQGYENRKSDTRVAVPEWLAERLRAVEGDDDATANVLNEAYADIAAQMPPDWRTRLNAWRYMAMLANPKTHIKNFLGNGMFAPVVGAKNKLGAVMELSLDKSKRTKTVDPIKAEYKDFAKNKLSEIKDVLTGGGKHNPMDTIQEKRRSFDSRLWEWLRKENGKWLEKEDAFFLNRHFINSFAGFLQARGVDVNNIDKATLNEGLDYAIGEAQKATFRDASEVADKISKFSRDLNNSKGVAGRAAGVLMEGALPFKKTPINIMKRGIEYSPVGLISTLATWQRAIESGSATQAETFDKLASGMTGTALSVIGGLLWKTGALKLDLDEPEDELEKLQGSQEYSVELFGKSVTIDWMSPAAMPLFVGGAIAELMSGNQEELNLSTFGDALMNIAEPVFNLSMLDGVNSLLSAASNSENGVVDLGIRMAESYASQFVPTFLGAVARTFDPTRRTTYTDKNIDVPVWAQYLFDSTVNKIPGASHTGQPYLNAWGEEDVTAGFWSRALENVVIPGYVNSLDTDDVETHLMELFDTTGETGLIPKTPQKYFTVQGERIDLTGEQYEQLTKERGQLAKKIHEELFANADFMALEPKYQVKALESVWDYTTALAKNHIDERVEVPSWATSSTNVVAALLEKIGEAQLTDQKNSYKKEMYSAISAEDPETAATCVAALKELGVKPSNLKDTVTNKYKGEYKALYEEGNLAGMRDLEDALIMLGIGFKRDNIANWID